MSTVAVPSTRTPSEAIREAFDGIFNQRDLSHPSRYWTDASVDHFLALGESVRGKDALAGFFRGLFEAFPDWTLNIEQTIDDGERSVVVQWTAHGTFNGIAWQGIEPTGRTVVIRGLDVITLDADGKVDENTVYYDLAAIGRQIGLLPRRGSRAEHAALAVSNTATKARRAISLRDGPARLVNPLRPACSWMSVMTQARRRRSGSLRSGSRDGGSLA